MRIDGQPLGFYSETLGYLQELGLRVHPEAKVCKTLDEVKAYVASMRDGATRSSTRSTAPSSRSTRTRDQSELGSTSKFPRWAIAYKFPAEEQTTRLKTSRSAWDAPARLPPSRCWSRCASAVSRSRWRRCTTRGGRRKGVLIGDTVVVRRAGEVIPEVVAPIPQPSHRQWHS